jgi:hypothetical protein
MKRFLVFGALLCAVTLSGSRQLPSARGASVLKKESAVAEFAAPVKLMNAILKGKYLFVHDEEKMEAGEDCTYVYELVAGKPVRLVLSFHCMPVARRNVEKFTLRGWFVETEPPVYELHEYQFAGTTEGHQVPSSAEAKSATVNLMACCE